MSFNSMAYTNSGISLLIDALVGKRLSITKAVGGTSTVDAGTLAAQTDVSGEKHALELLGIKATGEGDDAAREITIYTTGAASAYTLRQIGLFGRQDGASEDTLLLLLQDDHGVDIPSAAEDQKFEFFFTAVIAISRNAKIALSLNADMSGLYKFIEQVIHDKTAHAKIVEITIPTADWKQEDVSATYGYMVQIKIEGVTSEQSPTVTIHKEHTATAQTAALCPVAETLDTGVLKLWAKRPPDADMTATVLLVSPKSMEALDDSTDDSTTSLLGAAICGKAICGM